MPVPWSRRSTRSFGSKRRGRPSTASVSAARTEKSCWVSSRIEDRAEAFRALHEGDPFIIPNPWDAGSAKVLAALGFRALAGTSSGFAFTLGRPDGGAGLDEVIEHIRLIDAATDLPFAMDLEDGYGDPARTIAAAAEAGAVVGSIED